MDGRTCVFSFVVLHYKVDNLTTECVESILSLDQPSNTRVHAVVIDNASNNGSMERLEKRYSDEPRVSLLQSNQNLGFSRANNTAFSHAQNELHADWVCVVNNDTVFPQKDFVQRAAASFETNGMPHVIGPDIFVERKGFHQSPLSSQPPTVTDIQNTLRVFEQGTLGKATPIAEKIKKALLHVPGGSRLLVHAHNSMEAKAMKSIRWEEPVEGCVLHGAAILFTPAFVQTGLPPFDPPTFLYEEENILAIRCKREGWRMVYDPSLQVIHHDDGSTDSVSSGILEKEAFYKENMKKSLRIVLEYVQQEHPSNSTSQKEALQ